MSTHENSLETILTFSNRELSDWSVVWSTNHVPGMDTATGTGTRRRMGRRRLRICTLALGGFLIMHCRVVAFALTGGFFTFMLMLIVSVILLANPLRHFEIYLGQWSISGPGRAFRIIPLFDGIGITICINAIVRAIICSTHAAIAVMYIVHSAADNKLPFTYCRCDHLLGGGTQLPLLQFTSNLLLSVSYCKQTIRLLSRPTIVVQDMIHEIIKNLVLLAILDGILAVIVNRDFDLNPYEATKKDIAVPLPLREGAYTIDNDTILEYGKEKTTVGLSPLAWRNVTNPNFRSNPFVPRGMSMQKVLVCNETYADNFPVLYSTPAYNFFYIEIMRYRKDSNKEHINIMLLISIIFVWSLIWLFLIIEKISHGRLIWNNINSWIAAIPWMWSLLLFCTSCLNFIQQKKPFRKVIQIGAKDVLAGISDALQISLYIHASSIGTELILGKGLNHYASGHIDPHLNGENVWHSGFLMILLSMSAGGSGVCALLDYAQTQNLSKVYESSLWVFPMYSKCTSLGNYSHLLSILIFAGLMFSYSTVAFLLIKTALHTIFEYRVKLVFIEQVIVAALILSCTGLSFIFTTNNGLPLLESIDALMTGIAMPFICALEMFGLIYVYRSRDFMSDMNIATEDNACSTRLGIQWQFLPFAALVRVVLMIMKIVILAQSEFPSTVMYYAIVPLVAVILAVPLRACHNAYVFLKPTPRRGV